MQMQTRIGSRVTWTTVMFVLCVLKGMKAVF